MPSTAESVLLTRILHPDGIEGDHRITPSRGHCTEGLLREFSMKNRSLVVAALVLFGTGCGTINTTFRGDQLAADKLNRHGTYCSEVPRPYSGVSYNACLFHAEPRTFHPPLLNHDWIPLLVMDAVVSAVADTLLLPYTVIRQMDQGSISIQVESRTAAP